MKSASVVVCLVTLPLALLFLSRHVFSANVQRTFSIDYNQNEFLKDGQVFRYVSGEMHYFRVPAELWRDRLRKMKFGGMNVVQTYIEWSSIEWKPGVYDFSGDNNITRFITEAQEEGLLVIVRPGPYICAEREMGGLPYWLLKTPNIRVRSSNRVYLAAVDRWLTVLLGKLRSLMYENGGPIIMLQVENEYGSYEKTKCDAQYTNTLRDTFRRLLGANTVLFTTDGNGHAYFKCGPVANVFATIDFGAMNQTRVQAAFSILRKYQPQGPLVNSEFYVGWLDYAERPHQTRKPKPICDTLDTMLAMNASVNIYMYVGGSNFGFSAGSNIDPVFHPVPTSYDYDAPISESGDLTEKFFAIKKVVQKYMSVSTDEFIEPTSKKMKLPPTKLQPKATIFEVLPEPIFYNIPQSFEQLDHARGFLLYRTRLTFRPTDPAVLSIPDLRDRAQVFVDKEFAGTLSLTRHALQVPIQAKNGSTIDILVENQGRIFYGQFINKRKGILSNVQLSGRVLTKWEHYRLFGDWNAVISKLMKAGRSNNMPARMPAFFAGTFTVSNETEQPLDSFLQVTGWTKGVAFLNGHNLGRYWPDAGPQVTLYAPSVYFKPYPDVNKIVLFELERNPCSSVDRCVVQFVDRHIINGTVPTPAVRKPITFVQKET